MAQFRRRLIRGGLPGVGAVTGFQCLHGEAESPSAGVGLLRLAGRAAVAGGAAVVVGDGDTPPHRGAARVSGGVGTSGPAGTRAARGGGGGRARTTGGTETAAPRQKWRGHMATDRNVWSSG